MSDPLLHPPYEQLGHRPFSFYPALVNIEHNEWRLRRASWSEILVANTRTSEEIWIPRRFVGEISRTDDPVMIVGLTKELEYKAGQVIPHIRRVIQMPRAVNDIPRTAEPSPEVRSASGVVGIRFESGTEKRLGKLILWALVAGIAACIAIVTLFRAERTQVSYSAVMQSDLGLTGQDDYYAVVRKLGAPAEDRWLTSEGEMKYRSLKYPSLGLSVILMGAEQEKTLYIGSIDAGGRPVDAISLPGGRNTYSLLRSLRKP